VARTIAQEIKVTLTPQEQARMVDARPVNPEAFQAYLKGRHYWNKRTSEGLKKAVEYFEQAIGLAPDWPLAYAGLADVLLHLPVFASTRPSDAIPRARQSAERALKLDESLAEAHASLAYIATLYEWDWPKSERGFQRALALSPNYAMAHQWYARHLMVLGRHDEAVREITKALEIDPLSLVNGATAGTVYGYAGDLVQAESLLRRTLELGPDFAAAHKELSKILFRQGRVAEAIAVSREAVRLSGNDPFYAGTLGCLCAKAGQHEEARRIVDELAARSKVAYVPPSFVAQVYAGLSEKDQVFEWLEKAYQERDAALVFTLTDPVWGFQRTDPRFIDLVRRVGLPPLEK
jgi:tetratricopeptide (TPR) repeat protein